MNIPEKGFYYHYKHDPNGPVNNYAYEFINAAHHTEEENTYLAIYAPLYESAMVYQEGKFFDARPLEMWMGTIEKDGVTRLRFEKITDEGVIAELKEIKAKLYGV